MRSKPFSLLDHPAAFEARDQPLAVIAAVPAISITQGRESEPWSQGAALAGGS
jgi:hypothetical protein